MTGTPTCVKRIVAAEVAEIVVVLVDDDVLFAIRSGGHSPMPFDASIDFGVCISLENLYKVSYDADTELASLGSGARWGAVYTELDKYNVTVVGGRIMDVGVGGLTLESGLSYLIDLYGLVCDNVVNYEISNLVSTDNTVLLTIHVKGGLGRWTNSGR